MRLAEATFQGYLNYAGDPYLRVYDGYNQVEAMTLRQAEAMRYELDQAIEEAKSEERKLQIRIAHREAAAE